MSDVRALPSQHEVRVACKVLGVSPGASRASVLTAWKSALRDTHPDVANPAARALAEERAKGVNAAKSTLLTALGPDGTVVLPPLTPARSTQPASARVAQSASSQPSLHAVRLPAPAGHAGTNGAKKIAAARRRHFLVVLGAAAATIAVIVALAFIVLRDGEETSGPVSGRQVGDSARSAAQGPDETDTVGDEEQLLPTPAETMPDGSRSDTSPGIPSIGLPSTPGGQTSNPDPGAPSPSPTPSSSPPTTAAQFVAKTPERAAEIVVLSALVDWNYITFVVDDDSDPDEAREIAGAINKAAADIDVKSVGCKTSGSAALCTFGDVPESLERGMAMHRGDNGAWMLTGWGPAPSPDDGSGE